MTDPFPPPPSPPPTVCFVNPGPRLPNTEALPPHSVTSTLRGSKDLLRTSPLLCSGLVYPILDSSNAIISKGCLFFLLLSRSHKFIHTSKKRATRQTGMKCKVRVSISFCQTTIKCYGHIKACRACWSAQWEYDILHCAGPHSGLCRRLQKNSTIRENSL